MLPRDAQPLAPEDFVNFLGTPEALLLVGGQAVNLWALHYALATEGLGPFMSRDLDVLGSRETLRAIALASGAKARLFPLKPPSSEIGVVSGRDASGRLLLVEVLRHVHGVTNEELTEYQATLAVRGIPVRVPGPVVMLQAKIANSADLPQEGRQDLRHVAILARLMPAYLSELEHETMSGRMTERQLVNVYERLLGVVATASAVRVFALLGLAVGDLFPAENEATPAKVKTFFQKRLRKLAKDG